MHIDFEKREVMCEVCRKGMAVCRCADGQERCAAALNAIVRLYAAREEEHARELAGVRG